MGIKSERIGTSSPVDLLAYGAEGEDVPVIRPKL
jgi:hypothetical protein